MSVPGKLRSADFRSLGRPERFLSGKKAKEDTLLPNRATTYQDKRRRIEKKRTNEMRGYPEMGTTLNVCSRR